MCSGRKKERFNGRGEGLFLTWHIGMTTYKVRIHLSETANEMIEVKTKKESRIFTELLRRSYSWILYKW